MMQDAPLSSPLLEDLRQSIALTGDTGRDVATFLIAHGCPQTARHCGEVAAEARRVALLVGADPTLAEAAGWLHDVSAIFPTPERVKIAYQLGIPVLPEEAAFPMIVHQKLSRVLAVQVFQIIQPEVLSAVECHTTLKRDASQLDKVLFVADKLAWDQPGQASFHEGMQAALEISLNAATFFYLRYMWERREQLAILHPWLRDAYLQMLQSKS